MYTIQLTPHTQVTHPPQTPETWLTIWPCRDTQRVRYKLGLDSRNHRTKVAGADGYTMDQVISRTESGGGNDHLVTCLLGVISPIPGSLRDVFLV